MREKTFAGNHRPLDKGSLIPALLQFIQTWKLRSQRAESSRSHVPCYFLHCNLIIMILVISLVRKDKSGRACVLFILQHLAMCLGWKEGHLGK